MMTERVRRLVERGPDADLFVGRMVRVLDAFASPVAVGRLTGWRYAELGLTLMFDQFDFVVPTRGPAWFLEFFMGPE